jgi:hypothetical protein
MRDGKRHELVVQLDNPAASYHCTNCGRFFLIRISSPSCAITMIELVDKAVCAANTMYFGVADVAVDYVVRKALRWPKCDRKRFIAEWRR